MAPIPTTSAGPSSPANRSACNQCKGLKRRCDRRLPCEECTRHSRRCAYTAVQKTPLSRRYVTEIETKVDRLQRLLARYAPELDVDDELRDRSGSATVEREVQNNVSESGRRQDIAEASPTRSFPITDDWGGTLSPSYIPITAAPRFSSIPPPSPARPPQSLIYATTSTSEFLEKHPKHAAAGYGWNERQTRTGIGNDGTASLSIEPDGEGYLGFASGATLLRILQICAGGLSLAHINAESSSSTDSSHAGRWSPTYADKTGFVDAYFQLYHTQYPLVHEATFRAQWSEVVPRPPHDQWEMLLNVILGIGAFCLHQPMYIIDYFLERTTAIIRVEQLESGSLTLVQCYTLLSNLSQKRNKPNAGSVYLGIAVRMAIGLGLHRELPLWTITPFEREVRRRIWWVVYIFDSGASVTRGIPLLLPSGEADVNMVHNATDRVRSALPVLNCVKELMQSDLQDFTPGSRATLPALSEPTIYSSLIHQASFHVVGNRCYTRVISTPPPSVEETLRLGTDLQMWHGTLPDWFQPSRYPPGDYPWLGFAYQKLFWRYCNLRIILFRRPFLERALKGLPLALAQLDQGISSPATFLEAKCAGLCLQNATDSIVAIHDYFSTRPANRLEWWYGLHFLFHASFVPLIALHTDRLSPNRAAWEDDVDRARAVLQSLRDDPLAERCLKIIELLAPPRGPQSLETGFDGSQLAEMFHGNEMWLGSGFGQDDLAQTLLPFADFATLASFWPTD